MHLPGFLKNVERVTFFNMVSPDDGGWSLTPMENLLRGVRNPKDVVSLELYGVDGVVRYGVRGNNGDGIGGMLHSYFPQARVERRVVGEDEEADVKDWLYLDEDEFALVQPLTLERASYLPLRIYDDRTIEQSCKDPLAGVIGHIGNSTLHSGGGTGDRIGVRLVLRPAKEDWNSAWRDWMQSRRDGEDRSKSMGSDQSGPNMGTLLALSVAGLVGMVGWYLWENATMREFLTYAGLGVGVGGGGVWAWKKFGRGRRRPYIDEELVEAKLKSLAFWSEVQLVRIYRHEDDGAVARSDMGQLLDTLRAFDDPAGNSWKGGKVRCFRGVDLFQGMERHHPFVHGRQSLGWLDSKRASKTALSAREVACLWHPPLGADEMATMERTASGMLAPYLADLSLESGDEGPLVGVFGGMDQEVRLPESSLRKHSIILGRSGVGKSTFIKHVIGHKLERKAKGLDDDAIVVIDPHADLVRDILKMVPVEIADKVRLLDFGRKDRVPGINLVDPRLFPDRDRCVDTIINTVRHLWDHWGGRLEDLLKRSLTAIYEYNEHEDTRPEEMLTMLDILPLLDSGKQTGSGPNAKTEEGPFQRHVLSRVKDEQIKQWFQSFLGWDRATRSEAVGPVYSRVGSYASNERASVIMGQRQSTIMFDDILQKGLVLLVSTAQGTIGVGPAALMGGTMVSLVDAALRSQEGTAAGKRSKCLVVCDEFQTVTGADWEGMLAESRKYGCSLMLATQSLARLDTAERKLKAGVLGNVGVIIGYQMAAEDARIVSPEMDEERVQQRFLVNLNPHHCYVRINSEKKCYPAFSMRTLPPPDMVRGSDESEKAVLASSEFYTSDWLEVRTRMNEELKQRLEAEKVGGGGGGDDPFSAAIRNQREQRVEKGALRGVPQEAVEKSGVAKSALEEIVRMDPHDPGLRVALDKRMGDHVNFEKRKVRESETGRIREEVLEEMEGERQLVAAEKERLQDDIVAAAEKAREEGRAEGRAELAASVSSGSGRRDLSRVKPPEWQK